MGNLIRKPSELEAKQTITMLVYGQPGVGKTTLAVSAPDAVLFDYDGGVQRINGAHQTLTVQIRSWEDTSEALDEIVASYPDVKTIVIDTVGKMLDFMSEYIVRNNSRMKKSDGTLSLQGYGLRKSMFIDFIKKTAVLGKNIIFVAHEKEEKRGDDTVKRPDIGGSSANDLVKELDLVGYMQMLGKDRTIAFNPTEAYYAKNTCNLPAVTKIPLVVDETGMAVGDNNFVRRVLATYKKTQAVTQEETRKYDALVENIRTAVAAAGTAEELNKVLDSIAKTQVYNSKMVGEKMAAQRAKALGLNFNAVDGRYE
jgi:phage nucleotide-binding protein|nr:MAG TPA: AAA domain protein [Caudoviricetes sp.]